MKKALAVVLAVFMMATLAFAADVPIKIGGASGSVTEGKVRYGGSDRNVVEPGKTIEVDAIEVLGALDASGPVRTYFNSLDNTCKAAGFKSPSEYVTVTINLKAGQDLIKKAEWVRDNTTPYNEEANVGAEIFHHWKMVLTTVESDKYAYDNNTEHMKADIEIGNITVTTDKGKTETVNVDKKILFFGNKVDPLVATDIKPTGSVYATSTASHHKEAFAEKAEGSVPNCDGDYTTVIPSYKTVIPANVYMKLKPYSTAAKNAMLNTIATAKLQDEDAKIGCFGFTKDGVKGILGFTAPVNYEMKTTGVAPFVYSVNADGGLVRVAAKYDKGTAKTTFTGDLGLFVVSSVELPTATPVDPKNPATGANDVVGVAAALAVVALVSGAAISLKK